MSDKDKKTGFKGIGHRISNLDEVIDQKDADDHEREDNSQQQSNTEDQKTKSAQKHSSSHNTTKGSVIGSNSSLPSPFNNFFSKNIIKILIIFAFIYFIGNLMTQDNSKNNIQSSAANNAPRKYTDSKHLKSSDLKNTNYSQAWGVIKHIHSNVNIRAQRMGQSEIVGKLKAFQTIKADFLDNNWYAVFNLSEGYRDEKNAIGYVYAPLLKSSPLSNVPLPYSGHEKTYYDSSPLAPLTIKTSAGSHYFVKVVEWYSDKVFLTFFVRGGESVETLLPLGSYKIKYASGLKWYGEKYLFGPNTVYSFADKRLDFIQDTRGYSGYTIELIKQLNGNLHTKDILPEQW